MTIARVVNGDCKKEKKKPPATKKPIQTYVRARKHKFTTRRNLRCTFCPCFEIRSDCGAFCSNAKARGG